MLVATAALVCCYILYRLAQAYWDGGRGSRRSPPRRAFGGRKDFQYTHLADGDSYEDDQDHGDYQESEYSVGTEHSSSSSYAAFKPLPDKPLPPLPTAD